jgi:hypothetical protein
VEFEEISKLDPHEGSTEKKRERRNYVAVHVGRRLVCGHIGALHVFSVVFWCRSVVFCRETRPLVRSPNKRDPEIFPSPKPAYQRAPLQQHTISRPP